MYMVLTSQEEMLFPEFEPVTSMSQESILTIGLRLMLVYKSMNLKKSHLQMTQKNLTLQFRTLYPTPMPAYTRFSLVHYYKEANYP
jgi:hypothetical protein